MINYNILNEFIEKLKSAGITHEDLINVANAYKDDDLQGTLTAGAGINISDDNVISASSNVNLYEHHIISNNTISSVEKDLILIRITNTNNQSMTVDNLKNYLKDNNFNSNTQFLECEGYSYDISSQNYNYIVGIRYNSTSDVIEALLDFAGTIASGGIVITTPTTFNDHVVLIHQ